MFNKIEDLYKKKSPYSRIKKKIFFAYIIIIALSWFLNIKKAYTLMLIILIAALLITKRICEQELNEKLHWRFFNNKKHDELTLSEIINIREKLIFKNLLKENNWYSKEKMECILNHYRTYIKTKIVGDNFWAIIAIVVSIVLAFVTKEGFDINNFKKSLPYLCAFIFITIMIYYTIKEFTEIKRLLKGEDGIYERLEVIFSELYIEYEEEKIEVEKKSKSKKSKSKKSKSEKTKSKNKTKIISKTKK